MHVTFCGDYIGGDGMPVSFVQYWVISVPAVWAGEGKTCLTAVNLLPEMGKKFGSDTIHHVGDDATVKDELIEKLKQRHPHLKHYVS